MNSLYANSSVFDILATILKDLNIKTNIKNQGRYCLITCPFHNNGQEQHPSCMLNILDSSYPVGFFNCLACGEHGEFKRILQYYLQNTQEEGKIEDILKLLSEENIKINQFQNLLNPNISTLSTRLNGQKTNLSNLPNSSSAYSIYTFLDSCYDIKEGMLKNDTWRDIPLSILKMYDVKIISGSKYNNWSLVFPVYSTNYNFSSFFPVGYVLASIEKKENTLSYKNSSGNWVKNSMFNLKALKTLMEQGDKSVERDVLYLVEGERDTMNLTKLGFPSLAILGCNNYGKELNNYILMIKRKFNFKYIVLLMDGDKAGQIANNKIYSNMLKSFKFDPNSIKIKKLPLGMDPAMIKETQTELLAI